MRIKNFSRIAFGFNPKIEGEMKKLGYEFFKKPDEKIFFKGDLYMIYPVME